ncbi:MAG: hypothetical protein RIN56_02720 [Sporomusaceae bacterium]|nr:hypothetical protein [Sporomusaceae bacterium]
MTYKRKSPWSAIDKDQLGYESSFNPSGQFHDGPRTADNDKTLATDTTAGDDTDRLS